ncbi:hypothetical protein F2Q68_00042196 [Brassica cretica]|uniref:Uncharacterized protein n=1 Tax=Brassica cretica TaxID=69181 RepID=A0A8S9MA05_BRACR|nr:hypothetical protein F2Q68_00042196 [Brassica cretica]
MEVPMSTIITFQSLVKAVVVRVDTLAALLTCLQRRHPHEKKHMKQFLIKECRRCFGTSPKRANELLRNMARVEIPIIIMGNEFNITIHISNIMVYPYLVFEMQQLVTGVSSVYDYERILHYRTSLWEHQQGVLNEMS